MLQPVLHCTLTNLDWLFDDDNQTYFCFEQNGELHSKITGKNIPDPYVLWEQRTQKAGVAPNSIIGMKLKPQDTTFALWNHWRDVADA